MSFRTLSGLVLAVVVAAASPALAQDARDFSAASARTTRNPNGAPLTGPSNAARPGIVSQFLEGRHSQRTVASLALDRENRARAGFTHLQFRQQVGGLDVYGTYVRAAISARGELVSVVENLADVPPALVASTGSHRGALDAVLAEFYPGISESRPELRTAGETVIFARGSRMIEDPAVTRIAVPMANGALQVGYLVVTWDRDNVLRHSVVGNGGRVLLSELRTNTDTYRVFAKNPTLTPQADVSGPGAGNTESPIGWVIGGTTSGNNVDAYLDRNNDNLPDTGGRPTSAANDFLFTADLTQAPTIAINQMAAVANLFYLNNVIHDKLYRHGFTEAAGNFQGDNFNKGGIGNDPVLAEAQDGGSVNNANFATPADGSKPRMQMYLWTLTDPNRDGDFDSDIVWHEYGHGLTWRMIGNMTGPFAGAIGEGMGDTLAIYVNRKDVIGEYSLNVAGGIRRHPYTNYPRTYSGLSGDSVHDDGELYAATMWKLLELWEADGRPQDDLFDVLIDGMNFTPAQPAFEHMRDGLIAAAATPAEDCVIWRAFAHYGIGEGSKARARCNFFGCNLTITESFVVPSVCSVSGGTPPVVTITAPGDGSSHTAGTSITFSGTATDTSGDVSAGLTWSSSLEGVLGTGASISAALTAGTHTVTASASNAEGTGSASVDITVNAGPAPTITLSLAGRRQKGYNIVDLTWAGATTEHVDIWRNGSLRQITTNGGFYSDNTLTKGGVSFTYKVCERGSTTNCSPERTIVF